MGTILRDAIVSVHDILVGCRTLIGSAQQVSEDTEPYWKYVEYVLDEYFFDTNHSNDRLHRGLVVMYEIDDALAKEVCSYIRRQLMRRIQNTFDVIYPNRHYTYTIDETLALLKIVESRYTSLQPTYEDALDETDAWIPPRLRSR